MSEIDDQLQMFEQDEQNRKTKPARTLSFGPAKCSLCSATIQTLPTRFWRSDFLLIIPCAKCDRQLMDHFRELTRKANQR